MRLLFLATSIFLASSSFAQGQSGSMPGIDISHASGQTQSRSKDMHDMPGMEGDGTAMAMHSMESHHMDMGPHMKMTALRTPQPATRQRLTKLSPQRVPPP